MAGLQAQQIVNIACQTAKCPGFVSQAGQFLNSILQDLCQDFDMEVAKKVFQFTFNSGTGNQSGPYTLPADYLRAVKDEMIYVISGVPYVMINIDQAEFDRLVQVAGINNYPSSFATDMSTAPPSMFVWPPPSGSYPVTLRYYSLMPDITTPETSATIPWFPNTTYLLTRLAGELMRITNDDRMNEFLGDDDSKYVSSAPSILRRWLKMKDDPDGRAKMVSLDRRLFGRSFQGLRNTKTIGW